MAKRLGSQTPSKLIVLPYQKSRYKEAVELYEKTGQKPLEWQIGLLKPLFAENEDGLWTHMKFGYSVPRRNGKNEVVAIRELYGLMNGEKILHTAHRTTTSRMAWERLARLLDLGQFEHKRSQAVGREKIYIKDGGRIEFRTRSSKGGLGEGYDVLIIDEAQEYTDDEETALKYVVSDSKNPQTIFCGTPPTPLSSGTIFTNLRSQALEGKSENTFWAEWSVDEISDPYDRDLWYKTNPSLGTILSERKISAEIGDDEIDFNIQRLGHWIRYNQKSAISANDWEALRTARMPKLEGPLFVGIKYGFDGANVALGIAVKTSIGKIFVEAYDCQSVRNGNDWILSFLKSAEIEKVAIDGASGQDVLAKEMKEEGLKAPILPTVREVILANSSFERGIFQGTIRHRDQPSLTQVVTNCEKRSIGNKGGFGYRSQFEDYDIALMDSVIFAHWLCAEHKPAAQQKIAY